MNLTDKLITAFDRGLRVLSNTGLTSSRSSPAHLAEEECNEMTQAERKKVSTYMRINHAGEIAAQGLYHGQILAAQNQALIRQLEQAAQEEMDHLLWCKARLAELNSHASWFDPLWYLSCFKLGFFAGIISNKLSLGLIAAVEQEVYRHLQEHIEDIPLADYKTRAILQQMQQDELKHRTDALEAGGMVFPEALTSLMFLSSRVMTKVSYYL